MRPKSASHSRAAVAISLMAVIVCSTSSFLNSKSMELLPHLIPPSHFPHFHLHQDNKTSTVPLCQYTLYTNDPRLTLESFNHLLFGYQDNDVPEPSFDVAVPIGNEAQLCIITDIVSLEACFSPVPFFCLLTFSSHPQALSSPSLSFFHFDVWLQDAFPALLSTFACDTLLPPHFLL